MFAHKLAEDDVVRLSQENNEGELSQSEDESREDDEPDNHAHNGEDESSEDDEPDNYAHNGLTQMIGDIPRGSGPATGKNPIYGESEP